MVNTVDSIIQGNNSTMIILVKVNKHLKTDRCISYNTLIQQSRIVAIDCESKTIAMINDQP